MNEKKISIVAQFADSMDFFFLRIENCVLLMEWKLSLTLRVLFKYGWFLPLFLFLTSHLTSGYFPNNSLTIPDKGSVSRVLFCLLFGHLLPKHSNSFYYQLLIYFYVSLVPPLCLLLLFRNAVIIIYQLFLFTLQQFI